MDSHTCSTCGEKFLTRAQLAEHVQDEHSHQKSDEVIVGMPPKQSNP